MARVIISLIVVTLIAGMVGCVESYNLTISSTAGGAVTIPGEGTFACSPGMVVSLVAEAEEGYHFVNWTGDVGTIADVEAAETTITMNDSYSITANFELDEIWYNLTISSTEGGSVTTPGEGASVYAANTMVDLVAEPDEHYHFVNWTGDVDTIADVEAAGTTITVNGDYSITANFELDPGWYSLTISSEGGSVTTPGEGSYFYINSTVVNLVAQPNEGYPFLKWTGDVDTIADVEAAATNITMYDSYSITAKFGIGICDWHDLDAIRDNLSGRYLLMNDLDSNTAGYEELGSETANGGRGWAPIGASGNPFTGTFNGQGYEIRDLFIDRPDENKIGLFGYVIGGVIKDIGMVNVTVTGNINVGGLVGLTHGTVSNSYSNGNVSGIGTLGGLVGQNGDVGTVSNSYSTASVTGDNNVGGLVGENAGTVRYSYSTGSVTGDHNIGGLVGQSWGTVSNSYSTASVTGIDDVGGLVGVNSAGAGIVSNSYSTGSVTGSSSVGGLVGENAGTSTVSKSFWDTETSGQATSDGGTGKTTGEMRDSATFSGATWNIIVVANPSTRNPSCIWNIVNGVTYPFLNWQS